MNTRVMTLLCCVLCVALSGCGFAINGGGATHVPPANLSRAGNCTLSLELDVWGDGIDAFTAHKHVHIHIYSIKHGCFVAFPVVTPTGTGKKMTVAVDVGRWLEPATVELKYYWSFSFDGRYNTHGTAEAPHVVPVQ